MEGCKVKFYRDPVRQKVVFSANWRTKDGSIAVDDGGFTIDSNALANLRTAMEKFSTDYRGDYDGCADGHAIAAVDEENDKLMYDVNEAAARAAESAK